MTGRRFPFRSFPPERLSLLQDILPGTFMICSSVKGGRYRPRVCPRSRVEHPQSLINRIQYHGKYQPFMPAAEYSFVTQIEGRGVFSFCMCPGGILVPSATAPGEVVLNGMSNSARNSRWANSGVVVSVEPQDLPGYSKSGALSLLDFQRDVEQSMFRFTGSVKLPPSV